MAPYHHLDKELGTPWLPQNRSSGKLGEDYCKAIRRQDVPASKRWKERSSNARGRAKRKPLQVTTPPNCRNGDCKMNDGMEVSFDKRRDYHEGRENE